MENQEDKFTNDDNSSSGELNSTPTENTSPVSDNSMNHSMNEPPQQNTPENNYGYGAKSDGFPPQEEQYIYPEGLTVVDDNKKSPVPFIIIGVVAALVISLVLMFVFVPALKHSLLRTFMPAEKYYQLVENDRIDTIRMLGKFYETKMPGVNSDVAYDVKSGFKITPADEFKDEGFEKIELIMDGNIAVKSNKLKAYSDFILNDGKIFDFSAVQDMENGDVYIAFPILSESYVHMENTENIDDEGNDLELDAFCEFFEKLVENIDSVEKKPAYKGKLKKIYVYEIKYDEAFRTALTEKIKPFMLENEKMKNSFGKTAGKSEALIDTTIEMFEELTSCKVYVDNKGRIIGRKFFFENGDEFLYLAEVKGKDMYVKVNVDKDSDESTTEFTLTKTKNGYTGKGISKDEEDNVEAEIDINNIYFGKVNGTFSSDISVDMKISVEDDNFLIYKVTGKATEEKGRYSIEISGVEDDIIDEMTMFVDYEKKPDITEEIEFPEEYFNYDQLEEYMETADMEEFYKKLAENEVFKSILGGDNENSYDNNMWDDNNSGDDSEDTPKNEGTSMSYDEAFSKEYIDLTKIDFRIKGNKVLPGMTVGELTDVPEADKILKPNEELEINTDYTSSIVCVNMSDKNASVRDCMVKSYTALDAEKDEYYINGLTPRSTRDDLKKYFPKAYSEKGQTITLYDRDNHMIIMLILNDDKIMAMSYGYSNK